MGILLIRTNTVIDRKMKKQIATLALFAVALTSAFSDLNIINNMLDETKTINTYYTGINPNSQNLKRDLHDLLKRTHRKISYRNVWNAFRELDSGIRHCPNNRIYDIYSSKCWIFGTVASGGNQCGSRVGNEGHCYNREHSWPKSWWGSSTSHDAHSDLFALFPTDGRVNAIRANWPVDEVVAPIQYESTNGSLLGRCKNFSGASASDRCFEPIDAVKGDFARAYFYFSVRYDGLFSCCNTHGINRWEIKPWMLAVLKKWHKQDPVDQIERNRNNGIFNKFQRNRNPFIDHPSWVDRVRF